MPPRRGRGGGISGPTSALTSFLREQGITAREGINYNPYNPRAAAPIAGDQTANAEAGPSRPRSAAREEEEEEEEEEAEVTAKKNKTGKRAIASDSEDLDASDASTSLTPAQKKRKAAASLAAEKKKQSKKAAMSDLEFEDDEDDKGEGPSIGVRKSNVQSRSKTTAKQSAGPPAVGGFFKCGSCDKQATYTQYTPPDPNHDGLFLCHLCAKAAGLANYKQPAGKRPAAPKKKASERRTIVHYEEKKRIPTLIDTCIQIIANHVEDVESLGEDLGPKNLARVNGIICKNRKMTAKTAQLFYNVNLTELCMNDCTLIEPSGFITLSSLCPNLTSLTLNLCGQLSSDALLQWADHLPHLQRLELLGPFLVRKEAWLGFFDKVGEKHRGNGKGLKGFLITQSPRFDLECCEKMVQECPALTELRLCEVGKLDESFLPSISNLTRLTHLDLSRPAESLPDLSPNLTTLLTSLGPSLTHLSLSAHSLLTDATLSLLLPENCPLLTHLDLSYIPDLDDELFSGMLDTWAENGCVGLESVNLTKAAGLTGMSLDALGRLAGRSLRELSINGWKDVEEEKVKQLGRTMPKLRRVDLGFCRNITDFTLKEILDANEHLEHLLVWGCNNLTSNHPRRRGLKVVGVESHEYSAL